MRDKQISFRVVEANAINLVRQLYLPNKLLIYRPYLYTSTLVSRHNKAKFPIVIKPCNFFLVFFLFVALNLA